MIEQLSFRLHTTYFESLDRLAADERGTIAKAVERFRTEPRHPGLRLHPIKASDRRLHSISPNMDLRVIVFIDGGTRAVLYADHHDRAYTWAKLRRVEADSDSGQLQLIRWEEVVRPVPVFLSVPSEPPLAFASEQEDYLLGLGVPKEALAEVRAVRSDTDLDLLSGRLSDQALLNLIDLFGGSRPAVASPPVADVDWSTWLHPSQSDLIEAQFAGPARVTGAAGTGKSVVVMHRAVRLARDDRSARVLVSSYSRGLAARLRAGIDRLLADDPEARSRVSVMPVHVLAAEVLGYTPDPVDQAELAALVARCRSGVQESDAFLLAEWDAVIDFWGVRERASYLAIERRGRGQRLDRTARERLWPVFASMRSELDASGKMTAADLCESAASALSDRAETPFDHLLLDEAQDLGPRELAFAIQVASRGSTGLFFAGDAGQRVFKYPFPWASVGVDVRGRSRHLRIVYRTSAEVRRFAARILPEDVEDEGPRSTGATFSGSDPEVIAMANAAEERDVVAAWVADRLAEGLMPSDIAILARTGARTATASAGLAAQPVWEMARDRVAVGTLADAKGLEFRAVAIVGCEDGLVPLTAALRADPDPEAQEIALMRERNLLYVGCTRARETLLVTHVGPLTRFLRES